jgi:hypothetical protein
MEVRIAALLELEDPQLEEITQTLLHGPHGVFHTRAIGPEPLPR